MPVYTILPLISFHSMSAGPVDTSSSGASYLSEEMKEKLAADLAARTGDSDVESEDGTASAGEASGDGS